MGYVGRSVKRRLSSAGHAVAVMARVWEIMSNDPKAYTFRPASPKDMPRLRAWLQTPEVVHWWGDPAEQLKLLEEDLNEPRMVMRIVSFEGRPFAYVQDYAVHDWPQPHFERLPVGSRAIDAFVGESDMIGRGHGSAFLRLVAERLKTEGAPVVAIDPDVDNGRARRAYEKAGFRGDAIVETGEGPAILMTFDGAAW
jgi:aminoglycoside 6'-N-acetyltransferase